MRRSPTLLAIAVHEAGHAAMRLEDPEGSPVRAMTLLEPGEDMLGWTGVTARWQPARLYGAESQCGASERWRTDADKDVILYLAGPIAELRWRRTRRCGIWFGAREMADRCIADEAPASGTDPDRVRRRLTWGHPGRESEAFIDAWLQAEAEVARLYGSIVVLGRRLHARGHLNEDEIAACWAASAVDPFDTVCGTFVHIADDPCEIVLGEVLEGAKGTRQEVLHSHRFESAAARTRFCTWFEAYRNFEQIQAIVMLGYEKGAVAVAAALDNIAREGAAAAVRAARAQQRP
jgi:hypothetical protein